MPKAYKAFQALVQVVTPKSFSCRKDREYVSKIGFNRGYPEQEYQDFSSACPWISVVLVSSSGGKSKPLLFGLDEIGRLQANGGIIYSNCSSFSFYSNLDDQVTTHLILATKQDLLFIVDISDIFNGELDTKYGKFTHINSRKRQESEIYINIWERGAKIVGVLHGDEVAIILQTTRGNLEIDFNIIVDYCAWQAFSLLASEFVRQVPNVMLVGDITSNKISSVLMAYKESTSGKYWSDKNKRNGKSNLVLLVRLLINVAPNKDTRLVGSTSTPSHFLSPLSWVSLENCPSESLRSHFSCKMLGTSKRERVNQEIAKQHKLGRKGLSPLQPPKSLDGFEMFGFSSPAIVQAIEALDRSRVCSEYWDSRPYSRPQGQISQPRLTKSNGGNGQGVLVNQHLPNGGVVALQSLFRKANAEELNSLYNILSDKPEADRNLIARLLNEEIHKSQPS
ncbi:hypothetical protein PIB30_073803 [Stylosanthes scabra]|uniref:ELP1 N-terminal second beta-propeller domain-containing protein n=1 Tax=Stylosanthes scabra TaxID=79078 RepID=A0ABU6SPL5_9FABA|nr:hypothetical protein [Stylosanthes scabra]